MKKIGDRIEDLGNRIVRCRERCEGVKNKQDEGYYPRVFFLDPEDASQVELVIVGKNPGKSTRLERKFYLTLAERNPDRIATFKDCQRVWRSIADEHNYFLKPRHLLKELGLNLNGLLWAEVAFCEKSDSVGKVPEKTFRKCSNCFLTEILKLLSDRKYVVCLGEKAFQYVKNLPNSNRLKVIRVHHPTGARIFANYFQKANKKENIRVTERKLKREILDRFRTIEDNNKPYKCIIKPDGIDVL
ncbi:hypothetical protein KAX03_00810 [Candidatus Bathyarchaeota archaeon]|nr:hypothetical protein [Candidatus Bathyarchaeota archaeon]